MAIKKATTTAKKPVTPKDPEGSNYWLVWDDYEGTRFDTKADAVDFIQGEGLREASLYLLQASVKTKVELVTVN